MSAFNEGRGDQASETSPASNVFAGFILGVIVGLTGVVVGPSAAKAQEKTWEEKIKSCRAVDGCSGEKMKKFAKEQYNLQVRGYDTEPQPKSTGVPTYKKFKMDFASPLEKIAITSDGKYDTEPGKRQLAANLEKHKVTAKAYEQYVGVGNERQLSNNPMVPFKWKTSPMSMPPRR